MPAAGEDRKFAVFGAPNDAAGRVVWELSPRKDGAAFAACLDLLVSELPSGPLVVVPDNVGYHKGRPAKRWWLQHQDRVPLL